MKKNIYIIVISLLLFLLGFVSYTHLQNSITENLKGITFVYEKMNTQLFDSLKFGVLCGITPILLNMLWNKTKTEKWNLKLLSVFIFLAVIVTYIFIKIALLKSKMEAPKVEIDNLEIRNSISLESLNFPLHLFLAQTIGLLILYLILKKKQNIA